MSHQTYDDYEAREALKAIVRELPDDEAVSDQIDILETYISGAQSAIEEAEELYDAEQEIEKLEKQIEALKKGIDTQDDSAMQLMYLKRRYKSEKIPKVIRDYWYPEVQP